MKDLRLLLIALAMLGIGLLFQPGSSDAAFHIMRIWEVGGGAYGNTDVQYVELRQASSFQNIVSSHEICFYDAAGIAKARFEFTANSSNSANGSSILIATSEFNDAWAAGAPDFIIGGAGSVTTALNGGDAMHPVQRPAGKVSFGDYDANCVNQGTIDSVAYGAYSGAVDLPPVEPSGLPASGTQGLKLVTALCHPNAGPPCPRANQTDYDLLDINVPANNPRNSLNQSGPLGALIKAGDDYYETQNPGSSRNFAGDPVPANFFDPGSEPFIGTVQLRGNPIGPPGTLGTTDTIVRRLNRVDLLPPLPVTQMVPIELVALNLVSVNPITVTYTGGVPPPETWSVSAVLNPGQTSQGQLSITQNNAAGGTFNTAITVHPRFIFTRISDSATRTLDQPSFGYLESNSPWRFNCPSTDVLIGPLSTNFCASVNDTARVLSVLQSAFAQQSILPACADTDADLTSNCLDTDDDNDRVADVAEGPCGGNSVNAAIRPERLDGVFAGVSDDGDVPVDEALPPGSENFDCDGDGYKGDGPGLGNISERRIYGAAGTANDQDPCGGYPTTGWPGDLATGGPSLNKITLTDLTSFIASPRKLGTDVGHPDYDVRWDLVTGNGAAPPADIALPDLTNVAFLTPPMLLGARAFSGPDCPWPP